MSLRSCGWVAQWTTEPEVHFSVEDLTYAVVDGIEISNEKRGSDKQALNSSL